MSIEPPFPPMQLKQLTLFSANNEKWEEFQPMGKSLYPLLFLLCRNSFLSSMGRREVYKQHRKDKDIEIVC